MIPNYAKAVQNERISANGLHAKMSSKDNGNSKSSKSANQPPLSSFTNWQYNKFSSSVMNYQTEAGKKPNPKNDLEIVPLISNLTVETSEPGFLSNNISNLMQCAFDNSLNRMYPYFPNSSMTTISPITFIHIYHLISNVGECFIDNHNISVIDFIGSSRVVSKQFDIWSDRKE